ncbi:transposase [Staphylococcus chromogenes]|nr:transposase [Staphylococcus chromogenes]UXS68068.1 transposase [Staphylococcus chromogenes]
MTIFNDISEKIGMKVPNVKIAQCLGIQSFKNVESLFYERTLTYQHKGCECCGEVNINHQIIKIGKKKSRIILPNISEYTAYLLLKKQRFYCQSCAQYFTAETLVVNKYYFISNNSRLAILCKAQDICSESSLASPYLVSPVTASLFIDEATESIQLSPNCSLPEYILMAEFKSVKNVSGSMSFIYVDALTQRIIDIVEDRRLRSLKDYFYRFSLNDRQRVQTVTIDMYESYMNLIKEVFPNAKIIIGRFHIVQALNRALNMARVTVMNTFRSVNRLYIISTKDTGNYYWHHKKL